MVGGEPAPRSSRRTLLRGAGGVALGALSAFGAAGCGSGSHSSTQASTAATPPAETDEMLALNRALDLEFRIIAVYTAAIPLLSHRAHAAAKWFLAQELSHVAAVQSLIHTLGGKADVQKPSYDLGHAKGPRQLVAFLGELESAQIGLYFDALDALSTDRGRTTIASIVGAEAQHASILALVGGRNPAPAALLPEQP